MASRGRDYTLYLCMVLMLIMATVNMLLLKFQGMQQMPMEPGGPPVPFQQPVLQTGLMMVGESLCLLLHVASSSSSLEEQKLLTADAKKPPAWIFVVPCCCDLVANVLVCMGLAFVSVSVAQMCRGTVVVFACVLSSWFLGKKQHAYHLIGVLSVAVGIGIVSLSALDSASDGPGSGLLLRGIALCIIGQAFQASMFVYEEKIMSQFTVRPLQVVGMEGIWGTGIIILVLASMQLTGYANLVGASYQILNSKMLLWSIFGSMLAVATFNFSGATVTQRSSAVARTTIKISSTILIWLVELAAGWNSFKWLQLVGFAFVALGTVIYNRIVTFAAFEPRADLKCKEIA